MHRRRYSGRPVFRDQRYIHEKEEYPLTEVVFAVLRLAQLGGEGLEAIFAGLEEADTLHMWHAIALLVVDLVREIDLVRQEGRLRSGQGHDRCLCWGKGT